MTMPFEFFSRHIVGSGTLQSTAPWLRLINRPTTASDYSNAQLDDYQGLPRAAFLHRPPLTLTLRARFSHNAGDLCGTTGFGFWNDPFGMTGSRWPTLPRALWFFFSSPPSNMALAHAVPGPGWKAATIDAWRWPFFLLAPTTPIAMLLLRIPALYRRLWPIGQRAIAVHEALLLLDMTAWHDYKIEWAARHVRFWVDEQVVLHADQSPRGPLGLVIWKDNQAMSISPTHLPHHQLLFCAREQWLEIADVTLLPTVASLSS
ncbi:MAG: hypothetical protein R2932_44205 [Caldilineaceae bacterium]